MSVIWGIFEEILCLAGAFLLGGIVMAFFLLVCFAIDSFNNHRGKRTELAERHEMITGVAIGAGIAFYLNMLMERSSMAADVVAHIVDVFF